VGFVKSILLLAGVALSVCMVLFAGYAIAVHESRPLLLGVGAFAAGALLLTVYVRVDKGSRAPSQD
jgi:hypothetical protein